MYSLEYSRVGIFPFDLKALELSEWPRYRRNFTNIWESTQMLPLLAKIAPTVAMVYMTTIENCIDIITSVLPQNTPVATPYKLARATFAKSTMTMESLPGAGFEKVSQPESAHLSFVRTTQVWHFWPIITLVKSTRGDHFRRNRSLRFRHNFRTS